MGIWFRQSEQRPGSEKSESPRTIRVSVDLYGRLLTLFPKQFREQYEHEMYLLFRDLCREESKADGPWVAKVWRRVLPDLIAGVLAERSKMISNVLRKDGAVLGLKTLLQANGILLALVGMILFANALWVLQGLDFVQPGEVPPSGPHPGWDLILPEKLVTQILGAVCVFFGALLVVVRRLCRELAGTVAAIASAGNALIAFAVSANPVLYPTILGWTVFAFFAALAAAYAVLGILATLQAGQRSEAA